jgi:hypothetical protein
MEHFHALPTNVRLTKKQLVTNALAYFGVLSVNNNNLMIPKTVSLILEYLGQNVLAYFGLASVTNKKQLCHLIVATTLLCKYFNTGDKTL